MLRAESQRVSNLLYFTVSILKGVYMHYKHITYSHPVYLLFKTLTALVVAYSCVCYDDDMMMMMMMKKKMVIIIIYVSFNISMQQRVQTFVPFVAC